MGEQKRRQAYQDSLKSNTTEDNNTMALLESEKKALCAILREQMAEQMKEEVRTTLAQMRADAVTESQNSGSGSAGAAGNAGEMYNASAMKNEPVSLDAVLKRLDALHAKMSDMEENDLKARGLRGLSDKEACDEDEDKDMEREGEGEGEIPTKGEARPLAADKENCRMDL